MRKKKAELYQWIIGADTESAAGFTFFNGGKSPSLQTTDAVPVYADPDIPWKQHLHTKGWAVVNNVLTPEQVSTGKTAFWNWISHCDTLSLKHGTDDQP